MAAYITVGAKTSHGGTVISGSPHTTHNGIPVSRKGDKVICKKCKKVTTILSGDASFIVDGAPIARGGDVTSCGAKLIASQQSFAESGFDVGSIAQAAPLVFPKSKPDALFGNSFVEDDKEPEGNIIAGNTYVGDPDEGGGGIDDELTKPVYSEKILKDASKPVYSDKKTTPNNKGKPKAVNSRGSGGETAEEYRKRVAESASKADDMIAGAGDFIEEAAPVNPTKGAKWVSGAAKVVRNKMKDDIKKSDKGIFEATGEVISDTFDDATKKARELANWWNTDLNPNYPKRGDDD